MSKEAPLALPPVAKYPLLARLLSPRVLPLLLLAVLMAGLVGLAATLKLPEMADRVETGLLDLRLRARSEFLTPSDDIVIVAMDRRTLDYGRNHPEMGITGKVMPRGKLAEIITAIAAQKPRAIVTDLYFDEPQGPADDQALVNAIRRAGNVYLGGYVEMPLGDFKAQRSGDAERVLSDSVKAFDIYHLLPWMDRQAKLTQLSGGACDLNSQGFGPLFDIPRRFGFTQDRYKLEGHWQIQCQKALVEAPASDTEPKQPATTGLDIGLADLYRQECLFGKYAEQYGRRADFLSQLDRFKLPLSVINRPPAETSPAGQWQDQYAYCMISPVLEPVLAAAKGMGIISVQYDEDSVIRQIPLLYQAYQGNWYPYLGLRTAIAENRPASATSPGGGEITSPLVLQPGALLFGHRSIPLGASGQVLLNWRSPARLVETIYRELGLPLPDSQQRQVSAERANPELGYGHLYRLVSALDVLRQAKQPNLPLSETPSLAKLSGHPETGPLSFQGKTVIYGDVLEDIHRTPMGEHIYGPEVLATNIDMLRHDNTFVRKAPPWSVMLVGLLFCAFIGYSQVASPRLFIGFIQGLCLLIVYWILNFTVFIKLAWWVPLIGPSVIFLVALMVGVVYRYYVHDREKRQLARVFSRYVSPQVMDRILADPETSLENLSGVEKELTVLFADLQGFTERFNSEDPRIMVRQLNEFFTAMTRIILKHEGTYDKYIGDAIMAFFGAPVDFPDHAAKACAAALEMHEELARLNAQWRADGVRELSLGIGLSTGDMIVGNFGSDVLQNFTVMGNAVNLGARLESLTRTVKYPIVISEQTMRQAKNSVRAKDLGKHEVKGFGQPVQVFGLEGLQADK